MANLALQRADFMPPSAMSLKKMTREQLSYTGLVSVQTPDDSLVWVVVFGGQVPDEVLRWFISMSCVIDAKTLGGDLCQYTANRVPPDAATALAG